MKFSTLYEELKLLDICKPVSPEEAEKRDKEGPDIKLKEVLDNVKKTKLPDNTWHVHGNLDLTNIAISSLENLNVSIVDGRFYCTYNNLTSLKGCPKKVIKGFYCNDNQLTSLEGCPTEVDGDFFCAFNQLTSLKGCSTKVEGDFCCDNNQLTSLKGCPKDVKGDFYCRNNVKKFTKADVTAVCDVKGYIHI